MMYLGMYYAYTESMNRLMGASLFTLSMLVTFVAAVVLAAMVYVDQVSLGLALVLSVVINLVMWRLGPSITDWINRRFYQMTFMEFGWVKTNYPLVAAMLEKVAGEYSFPIPKIGIIPDQNPTAFTYGSHRGNARIVLTEGLFTYLTPEEAAAVVAHELGHVVNRDFIVMMVGSTLVQMLYVIYAALIRARGKRSGGAKAVALLSYVLYLVGIYLLYFLSRMREYLADQFVVTQGLGAELGRALVKIAYGIVMAGDDEKSKSLLNSTRHLGVIDVKNARNLGVLTHLGKLNPQILVEVLAFDFFNPWGKVSELSSTHPLTGKRLLALEKVAGPYLGISLESGVARLAVNRGMLRRQFLIDLLMGWMPYWLVLAGLFVGPMVWLPAWFGLGMLVSIFYRFPQGGDFGKTSQLHMMRNVYASPVKGKPVSLAGEIVGRGMPGFVLGEDMIFRDPTGLVYLDYTSVAGGLGNLFFGWKKLKKLLGKQAKARGWFFRGLSSSVTMAEMNVEGEKISSHPLLWQVVKAVLLILVSVVLWMWLMS